MSVSVFGDHGDHFIEVLHSSSVRSRSSPSFFHACIEVFIFGVTGVLGRIEQLLRFQYVYVIKTQYSYYTPDFSVSGIGLRAIPTHC